MKKIMNLYNSCKTAIRVTYFGFVLLAVGFLIQNRSVNIFYTFSSNFILFIGELFLKIGEFIVMNLPLIFMLNIVCKKANNASPVIMALVGYFTFIVTTMLFSPQTLDSYAYASGYGINSVFNLSSGTRLPLETGMIGSLLVAFATRISFIFSRHRNNFSLANLISKEATGIVYNILLCLFLGIAVSYCYPFLYKNLQLVIQFIATDLLDPFRIALFSVLDRVLSILGLGNIIRYPFWFSSLGGSYSNAVTGQSVLGDVSIWSYVNGSDSTFVGAGRFITVYYVINMFIVPAIYIGTLTSMSDIKDRKSLAVIFIIGILLSIIAGNPLPVELLLAMTSPVLLLIYLVIVACASGSLIAFESFIGFSTNVTNTVIAMPGSFPDFIVNIRDLSMFHSIQVLLIVGVIAFVVSLLATKIYYKFIAFDFVKSSDNEKLITNIIKAVGGKGNIDYVGSSLFKLNIYLINPEAILIDEIQQLGPSNVVETKDGVNLEFGTSSYAISKRIQEKLK